MFRPNLTVLLPLVLMSAAMPALAHRHEPPAAAPAASTHAPRFADAAALRQAMDGVRNAVEAFAHARHGHMGPAQVRALTDHLDSQVARVFRDCKLAPEADSALHPVLLTMLEADRALREKPDDFTPVDAMDRALADYARLFDDPGMREALAR